MNVVDLVDEPSETVTFIDPLHWMHPFSRLDQMLWMYPGQGTIELHLVVLNGQKRLTGSN